MEVYLTYYDYPYEGIWDIKVHKTFEEAKERWGKLNFERLKNKHLECLNVWKDVEYGECYIDLRTL